MSSKRRWRPAAMLLTVLTAISGLSLPVAAYALTTAYEIEGEWGIGTPNPVESGMGLTTVWRYNINDADPAPENPAEANVTITFAAQNAKFTEVPTVCLTDGVTPGSEITGNGSTLVCNVGTRNHGTAELILPGVQATGITGDKVTMTGTVGEPGVNDVSAALPELDMANTFAMDMKFDGGTPATAAASGSLQNLSFPWSLRHAPGSAAGPDSVSYDLSFTGTNGEAVTTQTPGCSVQNTANPTFPYSGSGFAAERTAPFPASCTLTQVSPNVHRLTLTGIDYSKTILPARDTAGVALPSNWDVVAAGLVKVQFTYTAGTTVTFTSTAPTYMSTAGESSVDLTSNNSNSRASTRGIWTGGWSLQAQRPAVQGSQWTDTFRTMPGERALAVSGVRPPAGAETQTQLCTVLDTKYATFQSTALGTIAGGVVTPYTGVTYEYFTGTGTGGMVDPNSAGYNPNSFRCDNSTGTAWQSSLPADTSTVKAVRVTIPSAANVPIDVARMYTYTQIRPETPIGQDVWTWTSYKTGDAAWANPHRTMAAGDKPDSGTLTPGSRYPYTGGGRDVLRIIAGQPSIQKAVDQPVTMPGATVNFTLTYRIDAPANTSVDGLTITDALPAGLTYVPGSASVAPTSVNGQTLVWNLDNQQTNTDYTILLSATVSGSADPGQSFTNNASIELAGAKGSAAAATRVRDGGYTFLTKTADAQQVPHTNGTAQSGWTVRLTSADVSAQAFTDTIDILPFNGDGRGTSFTGSYQLAGPVTAVPGAAVYYTAAPPATLVDDPANAANGVAGDPTGNTVGWTTTFRADATAVRVVGPQLPAGAAQEFKIDVTTSGAAFGDLYVNRAEARAARTELVMRTSDWFQIAAVDSVLIKKYVQDADGGWHDAQNVDDYPEFHNGDTARYRLVVTNTGDQEITNLQLSDDKVDLAGLSPLPDGLAPGAVIPLLAPGAENAVTFEYDVVLSGHAAGHNLINNACVTPQDGGIDPSCDPAGLVILPSSLGWEKTAAGTTEYLAGSEWELVLVDQDREPSGTPMAVTDCVEDEAASCAGPDRNPEAGRFLVDGLPDGEYRMVETRAPAGYVIDGTPRYITVQGVVNLPDPIENELAAGPVLPLTGGIGTLPILLGGGAATGTALLLVLLRRRSHAAAA